MKHRLSIDLKSMIIGALASLLVVVALGNSPVPEPVPQSRNIVDYKVVSITNFVGAGAKSGKLLEKVKNEMQNGWQPLGGVTAGDISQNGVTMVFSAQAMVKYGQ